MGNGIADVGRSRVQCLAINWKILCILKHGKDMMTSMLENYFESPINCTISLIHSFTKLLWRPYFITCIVEEEHDGE